MISLREFLDGPISETVEDVGFSHSSDGFTFLLRGPCRAIIQFRSHPYPEPWLGFIIEWDVIPSASIEFFRAQGEETIRSGWGLFAARVMAPAAFTLYQEYDDSVWAPKDPDTITAAISYLVEYMGRLTLWLKDAVEPEYLLDHFDEARSFGFPQVAGT